ncbi:MAG: hypothetical protein CVV42_12425 [Candidatus Riflebacteria bacterium HGW-Riflebacteria-2]|jgi:hypothetical protein|nr:MAG: hypothetical protein CVV42_12425 [Candidatus Riflebacteria bacterium HGW-Riflebacteria-2]
MEKPELLIAGLCVLAIAIYFFYRWYVLRRKIIDIIATPTSKISTLLNAKQNAGNVVEVKGKLVADNEVLKSPYANKDCVYYHSVEKNKIREVSQPSGSRRKHVRVYLEVFSETKSDKRFFIEDNTGRIPIDPEGAEVDGMFVHKTIEPVGGGDSSGFFGSMFEPCGSKIIAVLKEEQILPANRNAYSIGELFVGSKGPFIGGSPAKDKTFFISLKTEEALVGEGQREMNFLTLGWAAFGAAGLALTLMAF